MLFIIVLLVVGIAVGALTGMTGSSGVLVVVPALSLMGLSFQESVGSSLLVDVITTSVVIYVYLRHKSIYVKSAISMGLGAVIGAQLGTRVAVSISQHPLEVAFVVLTVILAIQMFRRAAGKGLKTKTRSNQISSKTLPAAFILSIPVGFLTGTLGTSGGIMFIGIAMILFSISAQEMVGTATLAMFFSAVSGVAGYAAFGRIDYIDAVIIGVTSLISGFGFSILAHKTSERGIYATIGTVFIIVALVEIFKIIL